MSKGWWITIAIVALLAGVVIYNKVFSTAAKAKNEATAATAAGPPKALAVNGFVVKPRDLANNIFASGSLLANEEVELHPEVPGRIIQLNLKEGTFITKGALLVKLYDADLQAQLKKLVAQKETAEKTEQRLKQLLAVNGIGQQDYDLAVTQRKGIEADMELMQAQITKTEIHAPFDGKIGLRNVSDGAYVIPTTIIATLQQVNLLKVDFNIPEKYSATIRTGDLFKFKVDGYDDKQFTGKVFAIEPKIDEATRTIKVRGIVDNTRSDLFPGAYAKIDLGLKDIKDALMVPTQCIIPEARTKKVAVISGGKVQFKDVETGLRNESYIQLTSGVDKGDTLVATGMMYLKPNIAVNVVKMIE